MTCYLELLTENEAVSVTPHVLGGSLFITPLRWRANVPVIICFKCAAWFRIEALRHLKTINRTSAVQGLNRKGSRRSEAQHVCDDVGNCCTSTLRQNPYCRCINSRY